MTYEIGSGGPIDPPEPAKTKVWAMYDGRYAPYGVEGGKWYPVRDCGDTFQFLPIFNKDDRQKWGDNWQRHVGPTPPDTQEPALQQLADMGQAFDAAPDSTDKPPSMSDLQAFQRRIMSDRPTCTPDADGWIAHKGSAKWPDGVGKRDEGEFWYIGGAIQKGQARLVNWMHVYSYRITKRAEKRRKVWLVVRDREECGAYFFHEEDAVKFARGGGTLYTAKLTKVTQ